MTARAGLNRTATRLAGPAAGLAVFAGYLRTACPTVYVADSGELAACAATLGIAHPTGYAAYSIIVHAFQLALPFGNLAQRATWLGAASAALAVGLLFPLARRLGGPAGAAAGMLALGFSRTLWSQAVVQEVYPLHLLATVLGLRWAAAPSERKSLRWLAAGGLLAGLAVSHHLLALLVWPALIGLAWDRRVRTGRRRLPALAATAAAGLLGGLGPLVYYPLRAGAPGAVMWGDLASAAQLARHVSGRQFHAVMFALPGPRLAASIERFLALWGREIPAGLHLAAAAGLAALALTRPRWALALALLMLPVAVFAVNYDIMDIDVYYIQLYLAWALAISAGVGEGLRRLPAGRMRAVAGLALAGAAATALGWSFHTSDRSRNTVGYDYGVDVLATPAAGGAIFAQGWSTPFVFLYLQFVLDYRPDVAIEFDAQGSLLYRTLERRGRRPVYVTVPVRPPGRAAVALEPDGLLGRIGPAGARPSGAAAVWRLYRERGLEDATIFKSFHDRALLANRHYMRAEALFAGGDEANARRLYERARAAAADNKFVLSNLGALFLEKGWHEEALAACRAALALDPAFPQARYNLAAALLALGQADQARVEFQSILGSETGIHALAVLGELELRRGDFAAARGHLERAYRYDPRSPRLLSNLGMALVQSGDLAAGEERLRRALEIDPNCVEAHTNLGGLLAARGLDAQAQAEFERALALRPGDPDAQIGLAVQAGRAGRLEAAEQALREVLARQPDSTAALNNLALALALQGRAEAARELWQRSLASRPEQPHVRENLERLGRGELDTSRPAR